MGFLRKIGRKAKKGIKKLFSSKIGSFLGGMAISMMLGPLVSRAWNGLKGVAGFGQKAATEAATKAATEAAAQELTTKKMLSTADIIAGKNPASVAASQTSGKALEIGTSEIAKKGFQESIKKVGNAFDFTNMLSEGVTSGNIPLGINTTVSGSLEDVMRYIDTGDMFTPEMTEAIQINKSKIANVKPKFGDGNLLKDIKQNFKDIPSRVTNLKDGSFVPDVAKGLTTSLLNNAILGGEEEDMGGYGRVASMPVGTSPQSAVLSDLTSQYSYQTGTAQPNFNFQNLAQQTLFGTGSSQFMGNIYQPIDLANILPITDTRTFR